MNGNWKSTQLYLTVLAMILSFVLCLMDKINGMQLTVIWTSGIVGIGARKVAQHRNDNPGLPKR